MVTDLQKASLGKWIIAGIFDGILISIIAVGLAAVLSFAFSYDGYMQTVSDSYAKYEAEYGVEFKINQEKYDALDQTQKENYDTAYKALISDKDVVYAYNMLINLTLVITSLSILVSVIVIEFIVPLFLKNGQTLGKKIFGIAVMHVDGIKISNIQLFARSVLGKFAIELMIPLSIILMIAFNSIGLMGIVVLAGILIIEIISLISTRTNSLIHDLLAGTVTVDMASQRIFENSEQLLE